MTAVMERELIPAPYRLTVSRLPSGALVIWQQHSDQMIMIPGEFVRQVCEGIYHASLESSLDNEQVTR